MKISIITVCKNAENAIERTMLSVVTQSCFSENIEYLIIDGASTDKTVEIIKQYSEKHPIKWISEPDSGIYNAMNKGIKMATGEYLLFLNAGDYLVHYNVIKSLTKVFGNYEHDVILGKILSIDPIAERYQVITENKCDAYFFFDHSLPHQAMFYKKDLFQRFGLYDEKYSIIADSVFNKKIICDGHVSIKYVNIIISAYFLDGISSINSDIHSRERETFQKSCFSEKELQKITEQHKREKAIKMRMEHKSVLRFLSKVFIKLHEFWVNR